MRSESGQADPATFFVILVIMAVGAAVGFVIGFNDNYVEPIRPLPGMRFKCESEPRVVKNGEGKYIEGRVCESVKK